MAVLAWRWERLFLAALIGFMGEAGRWLVLGRVLVGLSEDLPLLEENSETVRMVWPSWPSAQPFGDISISVISHSCPTVALPKDLPLLEEKSKTFCVWVIMTICTGIWTHKYAMVCHHEQWQWVSCSADAIWHEISLDVQNRRWVYDSSMQAYNHVWIAFNVSSKIRSAYPPPCLTSWIRLL